MELLSFFLILLMVLLSVVFFTLTELKGLGMGHLRLGPDKVGPFGYLQALSDFLKLFQKGFGVMNSSFLFFFFLSPFWGLFFGFFIWVNYFGLFLFSVYSWNILLFFVVTSLSVFFVLYSGWASGGVFSSYGSYRASVQLISYEVSMFFLIIIMSLFMREFDFSVFFDFFTSLFICICFSPIFISWLLCCLAETNRPPFDFSEGESELVSGFNIEYSGGMFSLIFVAEYSFMLFYSYVTSLYFLGSSFLFLKIILIIIFFIWVRCSFPRLRFDKLMFFNWKCVLPLVLSYYLLFFSFL